MCKLKTKLGGSRTATPYNMNLHLFLCNKQSAAKHFLMTSPYHYYLNYGGSLTATPYGINLHLFLCNKQSAVKHFPMTSP